MFASMGPLATCPAKLGLPGLTPRSTDRMNRELCQWHASLVGRGGTPVSFQGHIKSGAARIERHKSQA
jgi:hypothetical protein